MARDECCYLCNECPNSFATLDELERHMTSDHVNASKANRCPTSEEPADSSSTEDFDMIKMELDMNEMEEQANGHSPTSSDSSNLSDIDENSSNLDATPPLFSGTRIAGHSCRICGRAFDDRGQLNVHYTHTHRDKPQYECEHCQAVFCVKRELSTHLRIHSGEQPHKCDICDKEFGTRQLLKKHTMWHTGKRSHVCPTCNKAFFQKGHLTQHLMIHKGGRDHHCTQCSKTFIFKFDLNRHMKIHLERGHMPKKSPKTGSSRTSTPFSDVSQQDPPSPLSRKVSSSLLHISAPQSQGAAPFSNGKGNGESSPTEGSVAPATAPTLNNSFLTSQLESDDQNNLAQTVMAQYQNDQEAKQRLLMMAAAQRLLGMNQTPTAQTNPGIFCALCNKYYPTPAAYGLHWSWLHFRTGAQVDEDVELKLNLGTKAEEMLNLHSDSATSSSCASSPQKVSPISQIEADSKFCGQCDQYRHKTLELEKELQLATEENDRMRDVIRRLQTFSASLFNTQSAQMKPLLQNSVAELGKLWALNYK